MPARAPLFHAVERLLTRTTAAQRLRATSIRRLALLVTGIMAAQSTITLQIALSLDVLGVTRAERAESITRRLRRILADRTLTARRCYLPVLAALLDWSEVGTPGSPIVLIVDDSSKRDQVHLLRVSLAYRGTSIPLAWQVWQQNAPLPEGRYWRVLAACLGRVASLLPADAEVVVLADRAFDTPTFIDLVASFGWHWIVRTRARGTMRVCDHQGRETSIAEQTAHFLATPNRRWKCRARVFKDAGWREASIIGIWEPREQEPLVVLTDLAPRWEVLGWYTRRFWTEPGFRNDKRRGWQWEDCQVRTLDHHRRLLLGMALATVCTLLLGADAAERQVEQERTRCATCRPKPVHASCSLFSLGLTAAARWLYRRPHGRFPRRLRHLAAPSWDTEWRAFLGWRFLFQTVRS